MEVNYLNECPNCNNKTYFEVTTKLKKFGKKRCKSAKKVERLCVKCGHEFGLESRSGNPLSA